MIITDFKHEYLEQAQQILVLNYEEELAGVAALPNIKEYPELDCFTQNKYGVAALEDGRLVGFWGVYDPIPGIHGAHTLGIYSPVHAHGAIQRDRIKIYKRMYQEAAAKWVKAGIGYHAITLYHHDTKAIEALFTYGFGHRCTDAIRDMNPIDLSSTDLSQSLIYREISKKEVVLVRQMRRELSDYLGESPCFMEHDLEGFKEWLVRAESRESRVFAAFDKEKAVAFIEVAGEGENFATEVSDIRNICGAYCLKEYRGQMVYQTLLNHVINTLKTEGFNRLGVDYESINPTAEGFWPKYFSPYTMSVTRRINECAYEN